MKFLGLTEQFTDVVIPFWSIEAREMCEHMVNRLSQGSHETIMEIVQVSPGAIFL